MRISLKAEMVSILQNAFPERIPLFVCKFFVGLVLLPVVSVAQNSSHQLIVKQTPDFEIVGDTTASAWQKTTWTQLTWRDGKHTYPTSAKFLYSAKGVYCLFQCTDTKITATLKEDFANLYNEDVVEIFFWPDTTITVYFEYELSPFNYELPIAVPNLSGHFFGWRPWHYEGERRTHHAATIHRKSGKVVSWTAEFFIPYELLKPLLKENPKHGSRWRANFYRIDYDDNSSEWSWQLTGKNFHDFENFGTFLFE